MEAEQGKPFVDLKKTGHTGNKETADLPIVSIMLGTPGATHTRSASECPVPGQKHIGLIIIMLGERRESIPEEIQAHRLTLSF